jgi:hypothetical protein
VDWKPLNLSAEERLQALRRLDIFHPWESVDEKRLCGRCRKIITGRQVKIWGDRPGGEPAHLECPSKGCLAVPLEWIMLDSPAERTPEPSPPNPPISSQTAPAPITKPKTAGLSDGMFGFLRVPPVQF